MTNKKKRWKIARRLREYGIDFDVSHKMARYLIKGKIYLYEAREAGGFHGEPNMVVICGRGCCYEQRGYVYTTENSKGKVIQLDDDEFNYLIKMGDK